MDFQKPRDLRVEWRRMLALELKRRGSKAVLPVYPSDLQPPESKKPET